MTNSIDGTVYVTSDLAEYYSNKSEEWAISDKIVDNRDYSSKYYANESKKQFNNVKETAAQSLIDIGQSKNDAIGSIQRQRDDALFDIGEAKDTAVSIVNQAKNTGVNDVNSAKTGALTSIQDKVNEAKDAALRAESAAHQTQYPLDTIIQSKAIPTGNISNEPIVLSDIITYKHSLFNPSKIEAIGTPIINDNGIASNFSESNYIRTTTFNPENKPWSLSLQFTTAQTATSNVQYILSQYQNNLRISVTTAGRIQIRLSQGEWDSDIIMNYTSPSPLENYTPYSCKISYSNKEYAFELKNLSTNQIVHSYSVVSDKILQDGFQNKIILGKFYSTNTDSFLGSIDLKQFSVFIDGDEIYNCLKSGMDIIKPDDYEAIGTPKINEDGIASNFSGANFIRTTTFNPENKPWKIELAFTTQAAATGNTQYFLTQYQNNICFSLNSTGRLHVRLSQGEWDSDLIMNYTAPSVLEDYTSYFLSVYYANNKYGFELKKIATNQVVSSFEQEQEKILQDGKTNKIVLGKHYDVATTPFLGSIDLNSFKIYINDVLVYQPCLKIPYTQSKTGSKIADSIYRDRVQDMYKQFGYAPYYTLDEENRNFTLPMGEIYGMIERRSSSNLANSVKSYVANSASGYYIFPNGYCQQWIYLAYTTNANQWQEVKLFKKYRDSEYSAIATHASDNTTISNVKVGSHGKNTPDTCYVACSSTNTGINIVTCGYLAEGEY